jgi:hypothetical protein
VVYLTHWEQGLQLATSCPISDCQDASAEQLLIAVEPASLEPE